MGLSLVQDQIWLKLDFELMEDPFQINYYSGK
jgi:hypothetical protein